MSVSSGSSLCGEDEHGFFANDEEDVDFYAILNLPRDASDDDVIKAYRKRCLIFHPDRHGDEEEKREAEKVFVQLKRAYETLMDPKQRAIYDALGVQGLDAQGWQLVTRAANPENIRREYEFLQRLRDQELMHQRVHPTSNFVVRTSLAGMFAADPLDRYGPQLLGVSMTQAVDCQMTGSDRVGLVGRVKTGNGRGDGNVAAFYKTSTAYCNLENTLTLSSDSLNLSVRASKNVNNRTAVILQPTIQWMPLQQTVLPSIAMILSMRLRLRWQGSIILSVSPIQSTLTNSLMYMENNQPKAVVNLALNPSNPHVRLVYFSRRTEHDSFTEMAVTVSPFGIVPSIHAERKLSRFSRIGCSLSLAYPSCTLTAKFKCKTGASSFEWSILLCDDKDEIARAALYGVVIPYATVLVVRTIFRPWFDRLASLFDDHTGDLELDAEKQEEAEKVTNLMRPTAERIRADEEKRQGVVIIEAKYGAADVSGTRMYPLMSNSNRVADVAIPLQAMVNDSQLRVYAVKSQLPGFYDPCPGDPKVLVVKYRFRGEAHAVAIADEAPLTIPLRAHRLATTNNSNGL